MKVLITGGAGFLGKKLATALSADPKWSEIVLFDRIAPVGLPEDDRFTIEVGDIRDPVQVGKLVTNDMDLIYHLAAVVSADAETNFDLGMDVNLKGTHYLLEAARHSHADPMFVFASSIAVYGGDLPGVGNDQTIITPMISYGVQKTMGELLVQDYSRKGFVDGRALRLPTIVVRPGKPNKAASTFASSIIREPLKGMKAVCPVTADSRMYILSPRKAVDALLKGAALPGSALGWNRRLTIPGKSFTVEEMAESVREIAGQKAFELIEWKVDPMIQRIVGGWMPDFDAKRGLQLGFEADESIQSVVQAFIEDEIEYQN